ncbi:MAG: hypothetical protein KDJ62_05885 [Rhodobiaceae bacterium]|nr:hypothetical protein [Rhodobiaceae bacterium]MCC0049674.1 hypothetical protein [Rhodobiaceae bacterium]
MNERLVSRIGVCLVAAGLALTLSACRENEQDRPLTFDKGTYGGAPDQALSEQDRDDLRARTHIQQF